MYDKEVSIEEVPDVAGVGFKAQMKLSFRKKKRKEYIHIKYQPEGFVYIYFLFTYL